MMSFGPALPAADEATHPCIGLCARIKIGENAPPLADRPAGS